MIQPTMDLVMIGDVLLGTLYAVCLFNGTRFSSFFFCSLTIFFLNEPFFMFEAFPFGMSARDMP